MAFPPLVLASASPRRQEILTGLGLSFEVIPAEVDELALEAAYDGPIHGLGSHLAQAKAEAVHALHPDKLIIAADTIVVVDQSQLGKPKDAEEAAAFLRLLSGRRHAVITGIAVVDGAAGRRFSAAEGTEVAFVELSEDDIAAYVASGEPYDKAGGYGIQALGSLFIAGIQGDYWNVVGFPVYRFRKVLAELGHELRDWVM